MRIREVMTIPAVTATEDSTIGEALRLLREEQAGSVPVVDERGAPLGRLTLDTSTVAPDDDVAAVAEHMRSTKATILPVVDGRGVIGTVTLECLVAALCDNATLDPYHRRLAAASAGTACPTEHTQRSPR